jgi:SAM-dependent methyltransferase
MLKHVSEISGRTLFLKGDASRMPLKSQSVDFIFAGLGDPYNTNAFWSEATRILRPGAAVIFTTPSFEWMSAFRAEPERSHALFELTHGGQVSAPSFIFPEQQQRALIEATGLRVEGVLRVILGDLKLTPISPKLLPARGRRAPVVTGFLARC